ncbi:hypothetical protein GCM10022273_04620 [Cellulomonas soli]
MPAPFGPRNPVTLPGCTVKLMPSTAVLAPYLLVRPWASIIARVLWSVGLHPRRYGSVTTRGIVPEVDPVRAGLSTGRRTRP